LSQPIGRATFLGTGTSHGVPMIGCRCGTCTSGDHRDQRLRPSVLLEVESGPALLVDTSPDLRGQALRYDVRRIDAVLFTHPHADHLLGLDEIRRYNSLQRAAIPCYGDPDTLREVRRVFAYAFEPRQQGGGVPRLELMPVTGPFDVAGTRVTPVPVLHGQLPIYGYRVGGFAYLTDCSSIPDASWSLLDGLDVLVLDALRHVPHPTHFTVAQALDVVARVRPRRALFTHIAHDLRHAETSAALPPGVELAYDGLVVPLCE
jgi:phosphoribosyl 1,2-cyclic phosphate phosphodiesterase